MRIRPSWTSSRAFLLGLKLLVQESLQAAQNDVHESLKRRDSDVRKSLPNPTRYPQLLEPTVLPRRNST